MLTGTRGRSEDWFHRRDAEGAEIKSREGFLRDLCVSAVKGRSKGWVHRRDAEAAEIKSREGFPPRSLRLRGERKI
jgi:hypothetical protein